ncbi:hypothetical protein [Ferrovibrio sp.]|uniref:hypothetical protein n=1 Tax=Ferrovibrio sp. TaxID=1917215 RepID=UPI0026338D79|nr:hypothetical protein [Ferrovibrio sp.]
MTKEANVLLAGETRRQSYPLLDHTDLAQFDWIIWNSINDHPDGQAARKVMASLSNSNKIVPLKNTKEARDYQAKASKLQRWVAAGGTLLFPLNFSIQNNEDELRELVYSTWPLTDLTIEPNVGSDLEPDNSVAEPMPTAAEFNVAIRGPHIAPVLWATQKVKYGQRKIVAGAFRHGSGLVVIGPSYQP